MLKDVDVITDQPGFLLWAELMEAFPEAKCIFWERPLDSWWPSMKRQVLDCERYFNGIPDWIRKPLFFAFIPSAYVMEWKAFAKVFWRTWCGMLPITHYVDWKGTFYFKNNPLPEDEIKRCYLSHNAYFLANCPEEKRLVLDDINCGWKVICDFIGIPEPAIPWPHENKKASIIGELQKPDSLLMKKMMSDLKRRLTIYAGLTAVAFAVYYTY